MTPEEGQERDRIKQGIKDKLEAPSPGVTLIPELIAWLAEDSRREFTIKGAGPAIKSEFVELIISKPAAGLGQGPRNRIYRGTKMAVGEDLERTIDYHRYVNFVQRELMRSMKES